MGVKLREKLNKNGSKSLYLDITVNGKRHKEYLKLTINPARTSQERQANKDTIQLAETVRAKRQIEIQAGEYGLIPKHNRNADFVKYQRWFVEEYTKKDIGCIRAAAEQFEQFLLVKNIRTLPINRLDENLCIGFADYLKGKYSGETPNAYFRRFKMVVKQAIRDKLIIENPTVNIRIVKGRGLKKDILSLKEIKQLAKTPCQNNEVKRAFLFSLYSGVRWVDVNALTYSNVNYDNNVLLFIQSKTRNSSESARVEMQLSPMLIKLIGELKEPENRIFDLPNYQAARETLKKWVEVAGISKNITWHCARHSFAVNLLCESKTDIKTVAELLGHSGLESVEVYLQAINEKKTEALNSLPNIDF